MKLILSSTELFLILSSMEKFRYFFNHTYRCIWCLGNIQKVFGRQLSYVFYVMHQLQTNHSMNKFLEGLLFHNCNNYISFVFNVALSPFLHCTSTALELHCIVYVCTSAVRHTCACYTVHYVFLFTATAIKSLIDHNYSI